MRIKTLPRKLDTRATMQAASQIQGGILRMRIACYLTDDGEINRSLTAEIAGILTLAGSTSYVLRPKAPETAMFREALDALMVIARTGCYWRKRLAPTLDHALMRASKLVTHHVAQAMPAMEAASMVEMAVMAGNFSALDAPPGYSQQFA